MAGIVTDEESNPNAPSAGTGLWFPDATTSAPAYVSDLPRRHILGGLGTYFNAAIAAQAGGFAADTYVTDSDLLIPSWGLQARGVFKWTISASKTAAGVAQPVYTVRIGSGRATTDTSRLALTGPAQTAIADIGTLCILCTIRNIGAAAVIQGTAWWEHRGTAANTTTSGTGFANDTTGHIEGTSASFDSSALAGLFVGLSINGGTSAVWSPTQVFAQAWW